MTTGTKTNNWSPDLYDNQHSFVYKYGENLLNLLNPQPHEKILDLGCGTGPLTSLIAQSGADVIGMDSSPEMVAKAQSVYPDIRFEVMDATNFAFPDRFDAVFSNAVFHWIPQQDKVLKCVYNALKPGGRLVADFGGERNVANIINAIRSSLMDRGHVENAQLNFWYFPSLREYLSLLEENNFRIDYAAYYRRETELADTTEGIKNWIKMFGLRFFEGLSPEETNNILEEVQNKVRGTNYRDGKWYADYKRINVVAVK